MAALTEAEIEARLDAHPELLKRFEAGDTTVLAELLEVGLDTTVGVVTIRQLADG